MRGFKSTQVTVRREIELEQYAWRNRRAMTESEAKLWAVLRGRKLGVQFRRQVVIGRYIVDFAAVAARLVVEVDGGYHALRVCADQRRDRDLARLGYRVLRLPAALVLDQPALATERIVTVLKT